MDNFDLRKYLVENKLVASSGKVIIEKLEPRWIIADPSDIDMTGLDLYQDTITFYKRKSTAEKKLAELVSLVDDVDSLYYNYSKRKNISLDNAEVIPVEYQKRVIIR